VTKLSKKELIEQHKEEIRSAGYETFDVHTTPRQGAKVVGTMYIKEKMDYGFHIYFIHVPDEYNPLAGVNGMLTEMYYDLRNREYWIKRNHKDVKFSERNVDTMFPSYHEAQEELFEVLSTENNKGLYQAAFDYLGKMGEEQMKKFGRFFYRLMTQYAYIEILHKAGIPVSGATPIKNRNGTSPREVMGLSKAQWKMYTKHHIAPERTYNLHNDKADQKMLNYLEYVNSLGEEFGLDKRSDFFRHEKQHLYLDSVDNWNISVVRTAERFGLPVKRLIRYIYFECDVSQGIDTSVAISNYKDYIRMVVEMEYERYERYPKFLKTAHDIAARNHKITLTAEERAQWDINVEKAKEFEYSYRGYTVVVPTEPKDLVREGNVLGHCVGSYVKKVVRGTSTLVFLREKSEMNYPLVTVEIRGDVITQARGKMNNDPAITEKDAINRFAKKFELKSPF